MWPRQSLSFLQATSINVAKAICFSQIGPLVFFSWNGGMARKQFFAASLGCLKCRSTNKDKFDP